MGLIRPSDQALSSPLRPSSDEAAGVEADVEPDHSAERAEGDALTEAAPDPLLHVRQDLDVVLQDLEARAARLRDLLEEEEILRRAGDETRAHLRDAREQVSQYLEKAHTRFSDVESLRAMTFLRAMSTSSTGSSASSQEPDYESLLDSFGGGLAGDLHSSSSSSEGCA